MPAVNSVDIIILVILFASFIHGFLRGFTLELISFIALALVGALSMVATNAVAGHMGATAAGAGGSEVVGNYQPIMAFMFGGLFACGTLFALFIARKMSGPAAVMGFGSQFLGAILGLLSGVVVVIAMIYCVQFTSYKDDTNWQGSRVVGISSPYVEMIATKLNYSHFTHGNNE